MNKTKAALLTDAQTIKVETAKKANSATRIGTMFRDIIDSVAYTQFYSDASLFPDIGVVNTLYIDTTNKLIKFWDSTTYQTVGGGGSDTIWANSVGSGSIVAIDGSNEADGTYAMAIGDSNTADGINAFGTGESTQASGRNSFSGGNNTAAAGINSLAFGDTTQSLDENAFTIGEQTTASAKNSVAFGEGSTAGGKNSLVLGKNGSATGEQSLSGGDDSTVEGDNTIGFGEGIFVVGGSKATFGKFNTDDPDITFSIGNGTGDGSRSNAFVVKSDGSVMTGLGVSWDLGNSTTSAPGSATHKVVVNINGTNFYIALTPV